MRDTLLLLDRKDAPPAAGSKDRLHPRDPFAAGRSIAFQDDAGFFAGHCTFSGQATVHALPFAEVIILVAGALEIDGKPFQSGAGLVLPRGFSGSISAKPGTRWVFNAMTGGEPPAQAGLIVLDAALDRPASPGPAPEVLIGPAPQTHALNMFHDVSGMRAGVWDVMSACARSFVPHRVHELMHFIEGEVTLTHRNGSAETFRAGDTILVPRGSPYAWTSTTPVVKYYCVL